MSIRILLLSFLLASLPISVLVATPASGTGEKPLKGKEASESRKDVPAASSEAKKSDSKKSDSRKTAARKTAAKKAGGGKGKDENRRISARNKSTGSSRARTAPSATEVNRNGAAKDPVAPVSRRTQPRPLANRPQPMQIVGKVILGKVSGAKSVGTVDLGRVFSAIPSYQTIKKEEVPKTRARYHILIAEANEQLQEAVRAVALARSLDLVVEKHGVRGGEPVDVTAQVLAQIIGSE